MKRFLPVLFSVWASVLVYIEISHFWTQAGGYSQGLKYLGFELAFTALATLLLYLPGQKLRSNWLAAAMPILGFHALHDLFFNFLSRGPRLSDLQTANLLFDFSPLLGVAFPLYIMLLFAPFAFGLYRYARSVSRRTFVLTLLLKLLLLAATVLLLSSKPFERFFLEHYHHYRYLESRTIRKNGRISTLYFHYALSRKYQEALRDYRRADLNVTAELYPGKIVRKRNVYIIVLESFLDPRLLEDTAFVPSPLADTLAAVMQGHPFSLVRSPVYGGSTSQAEFEVLTGAPALARLGSIEFNSMEGYAMDSFVRQLHRAGYKTFATVATSSLYFNSKLAYKSLGFDTVDFLEETPRFRRNENDEHIFDGDLFRYNLKKLENEKGPYLFYSLGMYGHYPFDRNKIDRPDRIRVTPDEPLLTNAANTFYYRTKALGTYLSTLIRQDPDALIYVTSDHLPPLLSDSIRYRYDDRHLNVALLLDAGRPVDLNRSAYFQIPRKIHAMLTGEKAPVLSPEENEKVYFKLMSESILR